MEGQPLRLGETSMDCEAISTSSSSIHRSQSGWRAMKEWSGTRETRQVGSCTSVVAREDITLSTCLSGVGEVNSSEEAHVIWVERSHLAIVTF